MVSSVANDIAFTAAEYSNRAPAEFPPPWADSWGYDVYGIWAEFSVPPSVVQRMRWIEPGIFLMGSPEDEVGRDQDEGPQHEEDIVKGFWLADTACTQTLWYALMDKNPSRFQGNKGGGPQHPVERVSWFETQAFLSKLQQILPSAQAALPTEAEWEYACRADTTTPFSFGENCSGEQANIDGSLPSGNGSMGEYRQQTIAVKVFSPNSWGLYQMHGNVWEWCADFWRNDYTQPPHLTTIEKDKCVRVLRGGCWCYVARYARSAFRSHLHPDRQDIDSGFRLVLREPC